MTSFTVVNILISDKCTIDNGGCGTNATCAQDIMGDVTCTCKTGFIKSNEANECVGKDD